MKSVYRVLVLHIIAVFVSKFVINGKGIKHAGEHKSWPIKVEASERVTRKHHGQYDLGLQDRTIQQYRTAARMIE